MMVGVDKYRITFIYNKIKNTTNFKNFEQTKSRIEDHLKDHLAEGVVTEEYLLELTKKVRRHAGIEC